MTSTQTLMNCFYEYDPDSSEMDCDNDASEEDMKVRYTYLMLRGGHEGEVYIPYAQRRT